jgi:DNA-binding transcriptional ArsR family regulator
MPRPRLHRGFVEIHDFPSGADTAGTQEVSAGGLSSHERGDMSRATIYNHMVVDRQPAARVLDRLFGALADATRRDILARVMDADASVTELAAHYDMSFAAVQKHVAVLERARLVTKRRQGRAQRVAGNPDAVRRATRLLAQFEQRWQLRVARLDALLATSPGGDSNADRRD